MKPKYELFLIVLLLAVGTSGMISPDQAPTFTSTPPDGLSEAVSNVTLIWEVNNADGLDFEIYMSNINITDTLVDKDVVADGEIRYRIESPAAGTYLFSVNVYSITDSIWSNVTITFTNVDNNTSALESELNDTNFSGWLLFIPVIGLVRRLKIKS